METKSDRKDRTIWNRIWYPSEEDYIAVKVFQMISIPLTMILGVVVSIFLRGSILKCILFLWFISAVSLGLLATFRRKAINSKNDTEGS